MLADFDPWRIAFVGDWHKNLTWARYALDELANEGVQAVVHVGDFGYWPRLQGGEDFLNAVASRCREKNGDLQFFFVDGNHEDHESLLARPIDEVTGLREIRDRVYHLPRGHRWEWGGVRFLAMGGAASVDKCVRMPYVDWFPEEEITVGEAIAAQADGPADVVVAHDTIMGYRPPGIPPDSIWPEEAIVRSNRHRGLLTSIVTDVEATHLVHGHFHTRYYREVYGIGVHGLDQNGSGPRNWMTVDMEDLAADVKRRRAERTH